jgi:hypothetical protein
MKRIALTVVANGCETGPRAMGLRTFTVSE